MRMNRMIGTVLALLSMTAATDVVARDLTFAVNNIYIGTFGLEPANNDYKVTLRLHQNIFEQLTKRKFNANGKGNAVEIVPALATAWRWVDELTWEADLRKGVKFHNGDEMTVEMSSSASRGLGCGDPSPRCRTAGAYGPTSNGSRSSIPTRSVFI